jgi:hypothetical protein
MIIEKYYWLSTIGGTWIPESGYAYFEEGTALTNAINYWTPSGYTDIMFTDINDWMLVSSFSDGTKYYKEVTADVSGSGAGIYGSIGYVFKYDLSEIVSPQVIIGGKNLLSGSVIDSGGATTSREV